MNDLVRAALDLVRADAEAYGAPGPPYIDADWEFYDDLDVGSPELIVTVADRVQDDIIEDIWSVIRNELAAVSSTSAHPSDAAGCGRRQGRLDMYRRDAQRAYRISIRFTASGTAGPEGTNIEALDPASACC